MKDMSIILMTGGDTYQVISQLSNEKRAPGCLGYVYLLRSYVGIIIIPITIRIRYNPYKYVPINISLPEVMLGE